MNSLPCNKCGSFLFELVYEENRLRAYCSECLETYSFVNEELKEDKVEEQNEKNKE